MSEHPAPLTSDLLTWLRDLEPHAYALVWAAPAAEPPLGETDIAVAGTVGVAQPGFDRGRLALEEIAHSPKEALRRWIHLEGDAGEDPGRQLVIIGSDLGAPREYTPGALAAAVPREDSAALADALTSWLCRRQAAAPYDELGWITAATAWACHMREFTLTPPPELVDRARAGEEHPDPGLANQMSEIAQEVTGLIDRLEQRGRTRGEMVADWRALAVAADDVPELRPSTDWLLDQIARRDVSAQQLRAVLEPDIADYLADRRLHRSPSGPEPALDPQRTAQLESARQTVRAYTAAAHGGHMTDAQQLLDAYPIPARTLEASEPATAWRDHSLTANEALNTLEHQREELGTMTDPDLLHAHTAYLHARAAQLHLAHDALGRLAFPAPKPDLLPPEDFADLTARTARCVGNAFRNPDRARAALDGQISYLRQEPVPAHRRSATPGEIERLTAVRERLDLLTSAGEGPWNAGDIRDRVQAAMTRPDTPAPEPAAPAPRGRPSGTDQHPQQLAPSSAESGMSW